jgi:hypothetical protein
MTVRYPSSWAVSHPSLREAIATLRIRALRQEARDHLLPRLQQLAARHDYQYKKVFLKNLKIYR